MYLNSGKEPEKQPQSAEARFQALFDNEPVSKHGTPASQKKHSKFSIQNYGRYMSMQRKRKLHLQKAFRSVITTLTSKQVRARSINESRTGGNDG